jgi:hypothetical protein
MPTILAMIVVNALYAGWLCCLSWLWFQAMLAVMNLYAS